MTLPSVCILREPAFLMSAQFCLAVLGRQASTTGVSSEAGAHRTWHATRMAAGYQQVTDKQWFSMQPMC